MTNNSPCFSSAMNNNAQGPGNLALVWHITWFYMLWIGWAAQQQLDSCPFHPCRRSLHYMHSKSKSEELPVPMNPSNHQLGFLRTFDSRAATKFRNWMSQKVGLKDMYLRQKKIATAKSTNLYCYGDSKATFKERSPNLSKTRDVIALSPKNFKLRCSFFASTTQAKQLMWIYIFLLVS